MNTSFGVDREILEVNTLGPLSLTKAVLPHMVARKSGHIAVVSSIVGLMGKSFRQTKALWVNIRKAKSNIALLCLFRSFFVCVLLDREKDGVRERTHASVIQWNP